MLNKKEIALLRKQYPADYYGISEQDGKLVVSPKKALVRVFRKQLKAVAESASAGSLIEELLQAQKLQPEDFEQCQVSVKKEFFDLLGKEAKRCKTRKVIYMQQLLLQKPEVKA